MLNHDQTARSRGAQQPERAHRLSTQRNKRHRRATRTSKSHLVVGRASVRAPFSGSRPPVSPLPAFIFFVPFLCLCLLSYSSRISRIGSGSAGAFAVTAFNHGSGVLRRRPLPLRAVFPADTSTSSACGTSRMAELGSKSIASKYASSATRMGNRPPSSPFERIAPLQMTKKSVPGEEDKYLSNLANDDSSSESGRDRDSKLIVPGEEGEYLLNISSSSSSASSSLASGSVKSTVPGEEAEYLESISRRGGWWSKVKKVLGMGGDSKTKFDKATIAKMGMSMLLSYGFVSNVSGCIAVSCAWFVFSKQTGLSPLGKGQWPKFLAVYGGFYVFLNVIRPARFALAVAISKYFDKARLGLQDRLKVSPPVATGLVVFFVNFCGSCALMAFGVAAASALSGVPVWAGR